MRDNGVGNQLHLRRAIIRSKQERGMLQRASDLLISWWEDMVGPDSADTWDDIIVRLNNISIIKQIEGEEIACDLTKMLLLDFERLPVVDNHEEKIDAIHGKLVALELTNFPRDLLTIEPALISEQGSETIGIGAYAVVDTVKIGKNVYARKSVALPRYRQKQVREAIRNEITVIRTLNHPHVIRVYLTYEDKSRFFVVMEPLADCDLETFLAHTRRHFRGTQRDTVWKWFLCLSSTLAFIHSKGIRHKDIKPRNILIKGNDIVFADFGSSHAFLDGDNSTTEGPSHGHTKMYCAPEVIKHGKRNRSADIFSLGCVFTELAVWLCGGYKYSISEWHKYRETIVDGVATNAYHTSLDLIANWFELHMEREPNPWLYTQIISKMLSRNPKERMTAVEISNAIFGRFPTEAELCNECCLRIWVNTKPNAVAKTAP